MYLKGIEIHGFKSFAHKTQLNFTDGVTAIVGPNGSGKSNISDAVRWVLGEQKVKQLRGSAMQDVIFAGTEVRKPQGFASVAITLDNSDHALALDYNEVTVSRRLFRSGESEYMLNGQIVRLKDIQELFYDTGIGKEGYSIIGQGQIETIINGKPEDRRGLFDEAVGIVKFKRRKLTSLKKLENEKANLQRVSDIVDELAKRLKPLERQSASARQYLTLRDEQKKLDLNLFIRETEALLSELQKAKENLEIANENLRATEAESEELKEKGSEVSERILELEAQIEEKRTESSKAELLLQNLNGQIGMKEVEVRSEQENAQRFEEQLQKLQKDLDENREHSVRYLKSLSELESSLMLMHRDEGAEASLDREELETLLEEIRGFKNELKRLIPEDVYEAEVNADAETPAPEDDAKTAEEASGDEDDFEFVVPDWLKAIKNKRNDLDRIREEEERNVSWLEKAEEEYNKLTDTLKELQRAYSEKQQEAAGVSARYESLRNIAERYEGFRESTRAVMREKERIGGIRGVVAELIRTDKRYEQAIEIALGGSIQDIVTDTERSAKAGIAYLKKTRQGRATFLPLDAVRYREKQEYREAVKEHGAIGTASSLVETEDCYRELINYLLGSVLVVNSIDNALVIAGKYKHALKIVTLEGELLTPGGSISGGAFRNNSNMMGRSRELEELKAALHAAKLNCEQAKESIAAQERLISDKNQEIERLNESLKDILDEKNELSYGLMSDMKLRYSELRQKTEFVAENIRRILSVSENAELEKAELAEKKKACEAAAALAQEEIRLRNEDIAHLSAGVETLKEELRAALNAKEELTGSQSGFYARRDELAALMLELQKEVLRIESQIEKEQEKLDSQTDYIWGEYSLTLSTARSFYEEELGAVSKIRGRLNEVKAEIRGLGPVNVQAIEEYKEVSERYTFLKAQQDDLIASEESIIGIIRELDTEMKKQFNQQFVLIREQFASVFRELFGGGKADLELVYDPDQEEKDELEAGIAINVQPPGKKLQNIMQLSGGEKSLTAIALLFAIQNLKPSPFCLLDEIEAALDDSNVVRFANYLHKLTNDTQFIVITHRRGTMESADRLYGVTMQEKGVSKLVSVDLITDALT